MFALSAMPALVPTASATADGAVDETIATIDTVAASNSTVAHIGSALHVEGIVSDTSSLGTGDACGTVVSTPNTHTKTVFIDNGTGRVLGLTDGSPLIDSGDGKRYTGDFTIGQATTDTVDLNGENVPLRVNITVSCSVAGQAGSARTVTSNNTVYFKLDNQPPRATATYECSPSCAVDGKLWVNVTPLDNDIAATGNTVDLGRIGGSATAALSPTNHNGPFTIASSASTAVIILTFRDTNGNTAQVTATGPAIDADPPLAPAINFVTPVSGSVLLIDATASTSTDVGANDYYVDETASITSVTRTVRLNDGSGALTLDGSSSGSHLVLRLAPATGFTNGQQDLKLYAKDAFGNPSVSVSASATPSASPASVTIAAKPGSGSAFVSPYGSFMTANAVSAGATTLFLWVENLTDSSGTTRYWTGEDPSLDTSWKITKQTFALNNTAGSAGEFNGAVLNASATDPGANASLLVQRSYRIGVDYVAAGTVIASDSYDFIYDKSAPVLATPASGVNNFGSNVANGVPQSSGIRFAVDATDLNSTGEPLSGVASVSVQVLSSAAGNPAVNDLFGSPAVMRCGPTLANGCMYGNVTGSTATNFHSNLTLQLPAVTFGSYALQTTVTDAAGNSMVSPISAVFNVVPRARLVDPAGTPFYTGSGVEAFVYGGYSAPTTLDTNTACQSNVCPVTALELYGRNSTTTGSTPGSTGVVLLWNSLTPRSPAPSTSLIFNNTTFDTLGYYNYSNLTGQPYPTKTLNPLSMQVMALSRVTVGSTQFTGSSPWTPVKLTTTGSLLNFTMPNNDTFVFMDTVNGTARFNVTFDKAGLDALPTLAYVVAYASNDSVITFNSSGQTSIPPTWPPAAGAARMYYNFSNVGQLTRGEYVLTAYVNGSVSGGSSVKTVATRFFAVEDQVPELTFPSDQASIFQDAYVSRVFNLSYSLKTGFANLTNLSHINVTLTSPNQNSAGTHTYVNTSGAAGYHFWLNGTVFDPANTTSYGNITIKLPDNASDGSQYFIKVTLQTDSVTMGGGQDTPATTRNPVSQITHMWLANATAQRGVFVDVIPAAAGVFTQQTNDTGGTNELRIIGFATDYGSGVRAVKARIIDLNTTPPSTFDVNANGGAGGFVPGVLTESWVGSDPVNITSRTGGGTVADIMLINTTNPAVRQWVIDTAVSRSVMGSTSTTMPTTLSRILLDRNHTYEINVAAADNISDYPTPASYTVAFDTTPPIIEGNFVGPASVGWHKGGSFSVGVSDNWCMLRVSLTGTTPSGLPVPRADFTPTNATATCGRPNAAQPQQWTLDLSQFPNVTDEVGKYTLSVEAVDGAGRVTRDVSTHTRTLNVTDTQPAVIRFLTPVPPIVATGGRSIVRAEVFENHKILWVNATIARLLPGGTVDTASATHASKASVDPTGNGTGFYEFWSDTDMQQNLTVGDYLWTIQADDDSPLRDLTPTHCIDTRTADQSCPKTSVIVRVTDSAPPSIQQEAPAAGVAFVNASPSFHWLVQGSNITTSGITLRTGPVNGTLSTASPLPTITALAPVGSTATGYDVTFTPASLASDANISVELTVTNANSLTALSWMNYTVDAHSPTVTRTVSNTVLIGSRTYATPSTRITLNASDNETSIASLAYRVNGGTPQPYTTPFAATGPDGDWLLDYTAVDAAGNKLNEALTLSIDAAPPVISVEHGGDDIRLIVSDAGVGVDEGNVTVHYAYGTAPTFAALKAKVAGNRYQAQLPGNATATGLRYYFDAKDLLGRLGALNSSANPILVPKDQLPQDLPPKLTITAPTNGSEWRDGVDLKWIAEDPEGLNVTIAIALREPVGTGSFLVTNGDNTGLYHVDITNKPSGSYTLVVTATVGAQSTQQTVTFTVPTQRPEYECLACPTANVTANKPISFGFGLNPIGTTVASATFNVTRDGVVVSTGILKLQNGVWTMTYTPTVPGKYKIFVTEVDADGVVHSAHEVRSFEVQGAAPPTPIVGTTPPPSFLVLLAIGILTIALAAYGAFVRWK